LQWVYCRRLAKELCDDNSVSPLVIQGRQIELAKARSVGEDVDFDDSTAPDREAHEPKTVGPRKPRDNSCSSVDEHRSCELNKPREGERLLGYDVTGRSDYQDQPRPSANRSRKRIIAYWVTKGIISAEFAVGGVMDILRLPPFTGIMAHLGYPAYFAVILAI
jgi:hypothetical protein